MPSLESEVLKSFLARLEETGEASEALVERLRALLSGSKLPKAEQLVELFSSVSGGNLA